MNLQQAAWKGRADLVEIIHSEPYKLRNVTGENPAPVSIHKPDNTAPLALAFIVLTVLALLCF